MAKNSDCNTETASSGAVKQRLLDQAERLFAEQGYRQTNVRQLAAAAGCNLASVNYYFGGKKNLYRQVWRRVLAMLMDLRFAGIRRVMEGEREPTLEQLLRAFAGAFIGPFAGPGGGHLVKLMAREMFDEVLSCDMFIDEVIRPTMAQMTDAIVRTCPGVNRSKVPLVIFSIIGQLVHAVRVRAIFEHCDAPGIARFDTDEMIEHVVYFSAAGIRAYVEGQGD